MTTPKRTGRLPALLLTLLTVGVAVMALILSTGGGSTAAAAHKPRPAAAPPHSHHKAHAGHSRHAQPRPVARTAAFRSARSGDSPAQMYLDDTEARRAQLIDAYDTCLIDNGAKHTSAQPGPAPADGTSAPLAVEQPVPASASAACKDVLPLLPKEQNPSLNSHYAADSAANVACLRDHGVMVHEVPDTSVWPDGLGWTYDSASTPSPDNQSQIEHHCMIAAFSHR